MSEENDDGNVPTPPPGMPPAPPAPPMPPGMEPPAPPTPPMPPGMEPPAPPTPPMPPGMEPPAPPVSDDEVDDELGDPMDLLNDMDSSEEEEMPDLAPPAPPEMPDLAPPAPPEMPDLAPPSPMDLLANTEESLDSKELETESTALHSETDSPSLAGGKIRDAAEVDAIPGHKLIGTLNEIENVTLNASGDVVKQSVDGVLTLKNQSDKDRLWDIDVILDATEYTDVETDLPFSELEAGADQSVEYTVEGPRMLCVRERIDTNPGREQDMSLSIIRSSEPEEIKLEIEVENMSTSLLSDVVVIRTFPVEIQVGDGEGYEKQGDTVTWNVGKLTVGESRTLSIPTSVTAESIDSIDAGHAVATYRAETTLSGMHFNEVDAHCRGFSYMVVDEDERPDNYRCQAVFENRSSFTVDLTKLTVTQTGSEENLFDVEDVDDDVLPDGRWESEVKVVHSTAKPTFSQELLYTVLPRVSQSTEGTVTLQPLSIDVLEAVVEKTYSLDVLRHYRKTELNSTMEIENTGSATINLLRITDDIPGIFTAPSTDSVEVSIDGEQVLSEQFRIEIDDGVTLEKNRLSPDGDGYTMKITIGTKGPIGLAPGHKMRISYPLVAPDPSPANDVVAAPARIDFSDERYGPVATRGLNVVPAVRVTHRKVNYDSGKEVFPAGGAGHYEAMIMFNNRADSALQDVVIHDVIPGAFELLDWKVSSSTGEIVKCDMKEDATTDGKKMSWHIGAVARGERIEVTYEFKGDPEAGFKVTDAQEIHGIDVGEEIDEEFVSPTESTPSEDAAEEALEDDAEEDLPDDVEEESEDDDAEEESEDDDAEEESEDEEMDAALAKLTGAKSDSSSEGVDEDRSCPICNADVAAGMTQCPVCSFAF